MAAVRAQGRELSFPRPSRHGLGGDMQEDCDLGAAQVGRFWWTSHRGPLSVTSSTTEMVVVQPSGLNRLFCLDVANLIDTSISAILHTYKRSRFARKCSRLRRMGFGDGGGYLRLSVRFGGRLV